MNPIRILPIAVGLMAFLPVEALADSYDGFPAAIQPQTYFSESREFSLHINPSHIQGRGPATYTFRRGDVLIWSAVHPFTFREAVVCDDGSIAGYGHSQSMSPHYSFGGDYGASEDQKNGMLIVAVFNADGSVRWMEEIQRKRDRRFGCYVVPLGFGIFAFPESDEIVIRCQRNIDRQLSDIWFRWRISTGQRLDDLIPSEAFDLGDMFESEKLLQRIHSTPLMVAQYCFWDGPQRGYQIVVFDSRYKVVWNRKSRSDDEVDLNHREIWELLREWNVSPLATSGEFTIPDFFKKQSITFKASRDESNVKGWRFDEIGRNPLQSSCELTYEHLNTPTISPKRHGDILLHGAPEVVSAFPNSEANEKLKLLEVDRNGDLYFSVPGTSCIDRYDATGAFKTRYQLPCGENAGAFWESYFDFAPDQNLIVTLDTSADRQFEFEGDGRLVDNSWPALGDRWWFIPNTDRRWRRSATSLELLSRDGQVTKTISRDVKGGWLEFISGIETAPDGRFAVNTHPLEARSWFQERLNIFNPDGSPVRLIELPCGWCVHEFDFDSKYILLRFPWMLIDIETGNKAWLKLESVKPYSGDIFLTPNRPEILMHAPGATTVQRFDLSTVHIPELH